MKEIIGTSNKILEINLSTKKVSEIDVSNEDRRLYLGGKGLGLKLLYDRLQPGTDPLGEENYLAFMMGVFMGTGAPCSGRFAAITKSPLTGIFATSSCGGPFGMSLKTSGYDGLLITGRSDKPIYLEINQDGVVFKDAQQIWGKDTVETQQLLISKDKKAGALVIGPAGEHKVLYANICSGERFLGRAGFGAVMGAKNVKAIVARGGTFRIVPKNTDLFNKIKKKAIKQINKNKFTAEQYRNYGTAANVKYCNDGGILPILNFRDGSHQRSMEISGETMKEKYNTKFSTCIPCSILCGHKGTFAKNRQLKIPEYESAALLGPNLGIFDTDLLGEWNELCGQSGMDTISLGATLAYVMEAGEKGLLKTELRFGSPEKIENTIKDIAFRNGQGDEFANGTRWLSEKYGGKEFAIHVKGLEMAAYDPRGAWGQGLSYAVANRGACHLSATTFALEVLLGFLNPFTTRAKARFVQFFEALYAVINSLHACQFTAYAYVLEQLIIKYTPSFILKFAMLNLPAIAVRFINIRVLTMFYKSITGMKLSQREMLNAGNRIHTLERYMNCREGISRKDDTLPDRFVNEVRISDLKKRTVPLEKMLFDYYKIRDFDEDGIPTKRVLRKYKIL